MTETKKEKDLLEVALRRFGDAVAHESDNRDDALEDQRFRAGEQWHSQDKQDRESEGRPIITVNRMPQFVRQVMGDMRQNRPAIKVRGVDDNADPEVAEVLTGLIRNIENMSESRMAYMIAADAQVSCGMGHWRVVNEYADDDTFDQDLAIRPIRNPFAVLWDPDSKSTTRDDAKYCFVVERMTNDAFESVYPDASPETWPGGDEASHENQWRDSEHTRVAEYWVKDNKTRKLAMLEGGQVVDVTKMPAEQKQFLSIVREEDRERAVITRYILSGGEILEGPEEWPGRHIPIIPVIGEEVDIGDRIVRHGVVRYAKDPQRLYNYWRTAHVETVALQPKSPYIGTMKQFTKYKALWNQANTRNLPFLPYDTDGNAGAPRREPPPLASPGMVQEVGLAAEEMKATTGIYDASLGNRSNETSGKAIIARQRESDVGSFVYFDNFAMSISQTGRVLIDLIPHFYDTERVVRILGEDETEEFIRINQAAMGPNGPLMFNDLTMGKYDVNVTTGPSYSTKRAEAAESMMGFVRDLPQTAAFAADLIAKAQDWPDADKFAERLKKTLPPGIAEEEGEEGEEQKPDPEQVQANRLQEIAIMQQSNASAAETAKKQADAELTRAKVDGQNLENAQAAINIQLENGGLDRLIEEVAGRAALSAIQQIQNPQPPTGLEPEQGLPQPNAAPVGSV